MKKTNHENMFLKPFLSEKFKGLIWNIDIDPDSEIVAIETRESKSHSTKFSAYNFISGVCLFKEITVEDSWHWGLDKAYQGYVFLHSYVSEQHPEHKGIIALNTHGKIAWQQFNKSLYNLAPEGIITYNPNLQPRQFELIDIPTGKILQSNYKGVQHIERDIILPALITDYKLIPDLHVANLTGPVFYLRYGTKVCYAYHLKDKDNFVQQLLIKEGETVLLEDNLYQDIQKLNPEAFFISRGNLFCIRNEKREFVSYLV